MQVVRQCAEDQLKTLSPKAMHAGIWKTAKHSGRLHHMSSISHVHAHLTAAQRASLTSEELRVADLNEVADAAAKKRALELQVDASLRAEYRNKVDESRAYELVQKIDSFQERFYQNFDED